MDQPRPLKISCGADAVHWRVPLPELDGLVDRHADNHLVSPALWRRIEGDPAALTRLARYRVHLHVLMLAEGPSRGIPVGGGRHDRLTTLLEEELQRLR